MAVSQHEIPWDVPIVEFVTPRSQLSYFDSGTARARLRDEVAEHHGSGESPYGLSSLCSQAEPHFWIRDLGHMFRYSFRYRLDPDLHRYGRRIVRCGTVQKTPVFVWRGLYVV